MSRITMPNRIKIPERVDPMPDLCSLCGEHEAVASTSHANGELAVCAACAHGVLMGLIARAAVAQVKSPRQKYAALSDVFRTFAAGFWGGLKWGDDVDVGHVLD